MRLSIALISSVLLCLSPARANCVNYSISIEIEPTQDQKVLELSPWLRKLAGRIGTAARSKAYNCMKANPKANGRFILFKQPIDRPAICLIQLKNDGSKPDIKIEHTSPVLDQEKDKVTRELIANSFPMTPPPNKLPFERKIVLYLQPEAGKLVITAGIRDSAPPNQDLFKVQPSSDGISLKQLLNGPPGTYYGGYDARPARKQNCYPQ